jgi:hypothetical protein
MKKVIGAGTSAALVASLLATVVAPSAFAAVTCTPGVGPAAGGTTITVAGAAVGAYSVATTVVGFTSPAAISPGSVAGDGSGFTFVSGSHAAGPVTLTTNPGAVALCVFQAQAPAPTIVSVTPAAGATGGGTPITIVGSGTAFAGTTTVTVGGTPATSVVVVDATHVTAVTGAHSAGLADVVVTTANTAPGTLTNGYRYTDTPAAPTVTGVAPITGPTAGGTAVTITGTGFGAGASVTFNGAPATLVGFVNSTTLTATTPAGVAGLANVVVTNLDGQSGANATLYTYTGPIVVIGGTGTVTATHTLTIPRGGTYVDATGASLTFTEGAKADFNTGFTFIINIAPASPAAGLVSFDTTQAIAVAGPDSLGLSAMFLNAQQVQVTSKPVGGVTANDAIEAFTIGNLHVKAATATTLGGVVTTITGSTGSIGNGYWSGGTTTASGYLNFSYGSSAPSINLTQTSTCGFMTTGGSNGALTFATPAETVNVTSGVGGAVNSVYSIGIGATGLAHGIGTYVSQTVVNCAASGTIASIGTVVDSLLLKVPDGAVGVQSGLNNQPASNITITEQTAGFIPKPTTCTLSITEAGVLFSGAANVSGDAFSGLATDPVANVSNSRQSLTFSTTAASTGTPGVITVSGINYDVLATATPGDNINVTVVCGGLTISPASKANAFVNNGITQTAAAPTVWIGYNDQQSGMISVKEVQTGFFGSTGGGYNQFTMCINSLDGATFTRAPWAVVATGDTLKLLDPSTHLGVSQLAGTLDATFRCATWSIYSASTSVVGQIDLRGSDASGAVLASGPNNGPRYNISPSATPGPVHVTLTGLSTVGNTNFATSVNAIKAFKSGVVVTALSQPSIAPGTTGAAGNLTFAETLNGQFVPGETITCTLLNSATNYNNQVFVSTANSNDLPIVSTNTSSGLIAHLTSAANGLASFSIMVDQSAFAPNLGTITVTNLHYTAVSGAILGAVTVECSNFSHTENLASVGAQFDAFVSNATIGTAKALSKLNIGAYSAFGLRPTTGYTTSTPKVTKIGKYITWKFTGGTSLKGQRVNVMVAKKINGVWGGPVYLKSAWADANGIVTFAWHLGTAGALNIRVQWPGNGTSYGVSTSPARGAYWQ